MSNYINNTKKTYTFGGKLVYSDLAQYCLHSPSGLVNISQILDKIHNSKSKYIEIRILSGCKLLYCESGSLVFKKNNQGIYCYHVNGLDLDYVLFYSVGELLDIEIGILADALDGLGDMDTYDEQQIAK